MLLALALVLLGVAFCCCEIYGQTNGIHFFIQFICPSLNSLVTNSSVCFAPLWVPDDDDERTQNDEYII
jgi:hypothetical protein